MDWTTVPARAAAVGCGDTLTQSTKLTADLDCSSLPANGTALTVSSSNITLDLNGHTIRGPNDPARSFVTGASVTGARDTVQGGTITGFTTDVSQFGAPRAPAAVTLRGLTLTNAATGADVEGDGAKVSRSTISGVDLGIGSEFADQRIERVAITANGRAGDPTCPDRSGECVGIVLADGGGALIRNSTISSLGTEGISFQGRSGGDAVKDSTFSCQGNGPAQDAGCIFLFDGAGDNVLARNSVSASTGDEIRIALQSGDTLTDNTASGSIDGSGIVLQDVDDSTLNRNTASNNGDLNDNGAYGLLVSGAGNLIQRNTANDNDLDGILSLGANTLTANVARDNHGLGIQALFGAIDGGHNRASGNTEPQCIGVICTP